MTRNQSAIARAIASWPPPDPAEHVRAVCGEALEEIQQLRAALKVAVNCLREIADYPCTPSRMLASDWAKSALRHPDVYGITEGKEEE